jgi:hypothetical protein
MKCGKCYNHPSILSHKKLDMQCKWNIFYDKPTEQYFDFVPGYGLSIIDTSKEKYLTDYYRQWNLWISWNDLENSYISWIPEEVLEMIRSYFVK